MGKIKNIKPREIKHAAGSIGNLYADQSTSDWRAPESLPVLDNRFTKVWFDSEWDGTDTYGSSKPIGYSFCLEDDRRFYLPFGHRGGGNLDAGLVHRWANRELRGKTIVMSEAKGDTQMARKSGLDFESLGCRVEDIQFKAGVLSDQRRSFKLDDLAFDLLGERKDEIDRSRIWELPASEVGAYAERDAYLTKRVDQSLDPQIKAESLERVLRLENDLIYCTLEMERNGAPLDVKKLSGWRVEAHQRFQRAIIEVATETGIKVNPNSSADFARLAQKFDIPYGFTDNGQPSFPDAFIRTIDNPHFQKLRVARALGSIHSKYLDAYWKWQRNGILRYRLHQLKGDEYGTISGRFSSSSKNIQQVFSPKRQAKKLGFSEYIIRELFIPESDDFEWIKADAAQIEFRGFVHYSKSQRLIDRYMEDPWIDFHNIVQELLQTAVEIDRDDTKNINFGKLYAMGRDKMARQLGVPQDVANALFDAYDRMFPEARELLNLSMSLAKNRGFVKTILGRRARFPSGDRLHSALNRVIQGTAADIMKMKLLEVYNNRHTIGLKMFFTVHDELDGQIQKGTHAGHLLAECLNTQSRELALRVPIMWEVKSGPNWAATEKGTNWSKGMMPLYEAA